MVSVLAKEIYAQGKKFPTISFGDLLKQTKEKHAIEGTRDSGLDVDVHYLFDDSANPEE